LLLKKSSSLLYINICNENLSRQQLPFVFNTTNSSALTQIIFPVNAFNENEQLLASTMSLLWVRFILNQNPNTSLNSEIMNPLINQLNQLGGWPMIQ